MKPPKALPLQAYLLQSSPQNGEHTFSIGRDFLLIRAVMHSWILLIVGLNTTDNVVKRFFFLWKDSSFFLYSYFKTTHSIYVFIPRTNNPRIKHFSLSVSISEKSTLIYYQTDSLAYIKISPTQPPQGVKASCSGEDSQLEHFFFNPKARQYLLEFSHC